MALTSITKDFVVKAGALIEGVGVVSSATGQTSTLQVNGGAAIAKNLIVGTTATIYGPFTTIGFGSLSGGATISAATVTNTLLVNGTIPSLGSASAGTIQTTGGVGIAKDIYVGTTATIAGVLFETNTTPSLASATAGAVQVSGGVGIAKDIYVGTTATIAGTLNATSTLPALNGSGVAAVEVSGGVEIAKDIYVGTTATIAGVLNITNTGPSLTGTAIGSIETAGGVEIAKDIYVGTTATIVGITYHNNTTPSLASATAGAIQTTGGVGIAKDIYVGTTATLAGSLTVSGISQFNGAVNTFNGTLFVTGTNIFTVGTGASNFGGTVGIAGVTSITNTTTAGSAGNTGALVVTGGILTQDNLVVKSTAYNTATNTANAIYTAGGIYADGGLTVGAAGPVLFKGPVTFSGTATYIFSTNTFYTDNIMEMHIPPTGVYGQWTVDDGKDIGIRFHYYTNSTDTNAALVLANDTKYLEWYNTGAEGTTGTFSGATYGTFKTGNIILAGTTNATTTQTGSFQVAGGAGIGLAVYAGGNGSFGSLTSRNLTTASNLLFSDVSGNIVNSPVNYNYTTGRMVGTADYSNTATNITGGASGSLPYQTAAGATTMLAIGTNGYILTVSGGNPVWTSISGLSAGNATTASNIAGGLADQIPYQSSPGNTTFNAGLRFNGTTFTATNVSISGNTNSASYGANTGSFVTAGGAAIAQDLYVGGNINLNGSLFLKGVGLDQITGSTGTFDFLIVEGTGTSLAVTDGATIGGITTVTNTTPALGVAAPAAFQVRGGVGIAKDLYVGTTATIAGTLGVTGYGTLSGGATISAATVTNTLLVSGTIPSLGVAAAGTVQTTGGVGITKDLTVGTTATIIGVLNITNTSPSLTSTAIGSIETAGGVGIAKDLDVGTTATIAGITYHNNATPSLASATAGAIQTTGGVGIAKDIYVGSTATIAGVLFETNTTPSLGVAAAGAVQVTGGVGIAKDIYVGTTATIAGSLTVTGFSSLNGGATVTAMTVTNSTSVSSTGTGALIVPFGGVGIGGGLVVGGVTSSTNTTPSLASATAGAVQVTGGVGIAKDIYVGTTATIAGVLFETNATPSLGVAAAGAVQVTGGVGIAKDIYIGTTATIAGITYHNNTTPSLASATAGAIQTTGGVGIAKDLYVGTTATFGGSVTAPNFYGTFNGGVTGGASTVYTQANTSVSGAYYPTFVNANNASASSMTVYTTSSMTITPATGAVSIGGNLTVTSAGIGTFQSTQDSNATNNGAIVTSGGIGVAKAATIGTSVTIGSVSTQTVVNAVYSNNSLYSSYTSGFIVNNSLVNLDTYSSSAYRTAKYIVQIVDGTKVHVEEVLVFHDGTNVYMTEYGISTSQGELGTFDAVLGGGTVTFNFTANYTPTSMTIKTVRTAITL